MKRHYKAIGFFFAAIIPAFLTCIYIISCFNAGEALSWDEFTNGLLGRVSNCGGNSAARTYCQNIALDADAIGSDAGNDIFDYKKLPRQQQNEFTEVDRFWTPDAKYLLRTGPVPVGHGTHEIIVVCDTPFGNVPQPTFWNLHYRTLRHAAGYSNGSVGWLTPTEFAQLDKSNFVELKPSSKSVADGTNAASFE